MFSKIHHLPILSYMHINVYILYTHTHRQQFTLQGQLESSFMSTSVSSSVDCVAQSFCIHLYTNGTNAFVSKSQHFLPEKLKSKQTSKTLNSSCLLPISGGTKFPFVYRFPLCINFLLIAFLAGYLQLSIFLIRVTT